MSPSTTVRPRHPLHGGHLGLIDNWSRALKDTQAYFWGLAPLDETPRFRRLVDLNVVPAGLQPRQDRHRATRLRNGGGPCIHGWVFDLETGYIHSKTGMIRDNASILEVCKFHAQPRRDEMVSAEELRSQVRHGLPTGV